MVSTKSHTNVSLLFFHPTHVMGPRNPTHALVVVLNRISAVPLPLFYQNIIFRMLFTVYMIDTLLGDHPSVVDLSAPDAKY